MINKLTSKKAIIFDMDGTLVDNIPFHKKAWMTFLSNYNINLNAEQFQAQNHGNIDEMIRRFFGEDISVDEVKKLGQEKEDIYRDLYWVSIKEIKGLTDFLIKIRDLGLQSSLATNGDIPNINFILTELKVRSYFHSITGGHEITRGKPDPEIFELALKKIGLKSNECIVIEDSQGGIISAQKAGIEVIGITTSYTSDELMKMGCVGTISDYTEFDINGVLLN